MRIIHRTLAWVALVLAMASMVAGEIDHSSEILTAGQVNVFELANWIKGREVVVADLREADEFMEFHLPGALNLKDTLNYLENADGPVRVVVYGYEDQRKWNLLRSSGHDVRFFANGVEEWLVRILNPVIYRFAPMSELVEFEKHMEIIRYFGGIPRYSANPVQQVSVADQIARVRRGCGF